ncbi:uncharacterized protein LOC135466543 [Liolophura sinensis]|uniref:uncharacterized protein LOC135466543 n=1 Tax=Liolophura sinensis TaxID=3198878 RepID=UPI00315862D6
MRMEDAVNSSIPWMENTQGQLVAATTFIWIFTTVGFFGNCLLIGCLLRNRKDRWKALTLFTVNLCAVSLLDCVVNLSVIVSTSLAQSWIYNASVCQFHTFAIQLLNIQITLALTILSIDRCVAVKDCGQYSEILSFKKILGMIAYTWIQALAMCFPIITDVIPSTFYPSKYLCFIASEVPLLYVIFMCLLCFIIPFFVLTGVYIYILKVAVLEKSRDNLQHGNLYDMDQHQTLKTKELHQSRFAFFTFLMWLLLYVPYLLANFYEMGHNSAEVLNSDHVVMKFSLPSDVDTILTWARCSFPAVFAVFSLCRKELRNIAKTLFTCRRNNSVVDLDSASRGQMLDRQGKPKLHVSIGKLREKHLAQGKESPLTPTTFQVPVLFATSKGIHLHKFDQEKDITGADIYYTKTSVQSPDIPAGEVTKCDVLGSQSDLIQVEDDTSDYDSSNEADRFSVSNPVSLKRPEPTMVEGIHRSLSNPEVGRIKRNMVRPFGEPVHGKERGVMPSDSGIDISSSAGNSMKRKQNWSKIRSSCPPDTPDNMTEMTLPSVVNSISSVVLAQAGGRTSINSCRNSSSEAILTPGSSLKEGCLDHHDIPLKNGPVPCMQDASCCNRAKKHRKRDISSVTHELQSGNVTNVQQECVITVKGHASSITMDKVKPTRLQPLTYCVSPSKKKFKHPKNHGDGDSKSNTLNSCTHGDSLNDNLFNDTFSSTSICGFGTLSYRDGDWNRLSGHFCSQWNEQDKLNTPQHLQPESVSSEIRTFSS